MNDNDFGYLADHDDVPLAMQDDMAQAMNEQEMMYVDALRRVVNGTATVEDAKVLAAGCGISFSLLNLT